MKTRKRIPLSLLVTVIMSVVLLLVDIGLTVFFTIRSYESTTNIIKSKLVENATTIASLLDANEVGFLTYEDKENNTERYQKAYKVLSSFQTHSSSENVNAELAYVYLLVKIDGKIVFSVDPSDDPGEFLKEEPINTPGIIEAFAGKTSLDDKPYTDRWGTLYSGFAPVIKSSGATSEVVAVVGVDVWADYVNSQVASSAISVSLVSFVTIALGVTLSLSLTYVMRQRLNGLSKDLVALESDIQGLVGDIEAPLNNVVDFEQEIVVEKEEGKKPIENIRAKLTNLHNEIVRYMNYAEEQASIDRLTKLANRNAYSIVTKLINEQIEKGELKDLVVAVYDVNGLKIINDENGHDIGDALLKISANMIKIVYGTENSFRIGGDEFVIVYRGNEEEFKAKNIECLGLIDQFNQSNTDYPFEISLSVGYSVYEVGQDKNLLDVFRKADKNMYDQKNKFYENHRKNR